MHWGGSGNPAILGAAHAQGPEALRPRLAAGLPFSDVRILRLVTAQRNDGGPKLRDASHVAKAMDELNHRFGAVSVFFTVPYP
jgi:hypothetical protein